LYLTSIDHTRLFTFIYSSVMVFSGAEWQRYSCIAGTVMSSLNVHCKAY
jgi:hypothetical protein